MVLSGFQMLHHVQLWVLINLCCTFVAMPSVSRAGTACEKTDFEAVVTQAADALRSLNHKNKPPYQARLKDLKVKRGWSHDQFLKEAAPLVQDTRITEFDERSAAFLEKIQTMGTENVSTGAPGCAALAEVRGVMHKLVEVQTEKWVYMFAKIEQEIGR